MRPHNYTHMNFTAQIPKPHVGKIFLKKDADKLISANVFFFFLFMIKSNTGNSHPVLGPVICSSWIVKTPLPRLQIGKIIKKKKKKKIIPLCHNFHIWQLVTSFRCILDSQRRASCSSYGFISSFFNIVIQRSRFFDLAENNTYL